ncbi:MAG TPA: hypothetical protein VKU01_04520 [Bryobacteraceae bacterium]|nr:hypothetical protein [Bryobacteraceae bacterium]
MASGNPKTSAAIEALIEKGLFDRLPVTFSTYFFDQIHEWDLLFPAERNYYERLFGLIDKSDPSDVDKLFADVRDAERKMGVSDATWPKRTFTLQQVDFLNRSAHYPEWRKAVSDVFAKLDPLLEAETARHGRPRLVVILSPAEMPVGPDRLWMRIAQHGKRIPLEVPSDGADYAALLLTGKPQVSQAPSIADIAAATPYGAWCVETGDRLAKMSAHPGVVRLSYEQLSDYRARLMKEVQQVVEGEQVRGPQQLSARLKQMKIRPDEGELGRDAILGEFTRAILLSGNGTLLINNTFVEWASVQGIRRARPTVTLIAYGIRNKVKPFSSLLIYADQDATTPIPTQADMLGSYVDLEVFHQYIWQEFMKYAEYRGNTAFLFVADGTDEMLAIAPPDFPLMSVQTPQRLDTVFSTMKDWLAL